MWLPPAYEALIKLSSNKSWHKLIHEWICIEKNLGYPGGVCTKFFTCNITDSTCFSLDQIGFHLLDVQLPLECGSRQAVISTSSLILRTIWIPMSKSGRNGIVVCSQGGGLIFLRTLRLMQIGRCLQRGGNNGLYVPVLSIGWWIFALREGDLSAECVAALEDVRWVFDQIGKYLASKKRLADENLDGETHMKK